MVATSRLNEEQATAAVEPLAAEPIPARPVDGRSRPGLVIAAVAMSLLFAIPLAFLLWQTAALGFSAVWAALANDSLAPLGRSLLLGAAVSMSTATIGVALAWLTTRTNVPGRRVWALLAPVPLVIPSYVGAAAFVAGFAPGGLFVEIVPAPLLDRLPVQGFWGAWFVLTMFSYPYVYLPVAARLTSLPPSYEETARLLGRRPWGVFTSVVLPQASPAIAAGTLLVFLYTISDFGAVSIMRYGSLTNELFQAKLVPSVWLPLSSLLALVALGLVAAERSVGRRQPRTQSVQGSRPMQVALGRWRAPAFVAVICLVLSSLVAPVTVLAVWAVRGFVATDARSTALVDASGGLAAPAFNTVLVSVIAAVVTVAMVLPVAFLSGRYRSRLGGVTSSVVVAAFALPGLVVALALIFLTLRTDAAAWLYQSIALLVFAYAVHFGAQALRASQVAVGAVPRRYDDAARMLGAKRVRRFLTVDLPLMRPGLLAGGGLVLLSTMKELPATLLLAPPNFDTLATRIWSASESHYLAQLGTASILLVAISAMLTWVLVIRRARWLD